MNSPRRGVPTTATSTTTNEAQLKWALVTARQRAQAARDRIRQLYSDDTSGNLLDDSQSDYSERKQWIAEHGYRHQCCTSSQQQQANEYERFHRHNNSWRTNESFTYGRRFDVAKRTFDSSLFVVPASSWREGRCGAFVVEDDDPDRTERFQMAFAAAVAAIERNHHPQVDHQRFPPSRFDSTSTYTASPHSRSTTQRVETPREGGGNFTFHSPRATPTHKAGHKNSLLVWTPQLREQVTLAAQTVLKRRPEHHQDQTLDNNHDDDEVKSFVRQFERFMLQTDDSLTSSSHEESGPVEVQQQPPQDWTNSSFASPIVPEEDLETSRCWTAPLDEDEDGLSTSFPQNVEAEESVNVDAEQNGTVINEQKADTKKVGVNTEHSAEIPGRVISFQSLQLPKKSHAVRPSLTQQHESPIAGRTITTVSHRPLSSASAQRITGSIDSAGCGLSVVRGGVHTPLENYCSARWERQMML
jgi:hypothetical protein